ncbi:hypothetical protein [Agromyces sp. Soil535]|uniref:hypothetical protein n=1 Tax=Agromyces sp. Soil535 TaxID=1736390 RepID=UPI0006F603D2|nr:hypothetical protein [Agromyces sp. Soil535]KRE22320.1 hypothetical protein ASG80_10275 [Agromyces sp. Soil535]
MQHDREATVDEDEQKWAAWSRRPGLEQEWIRQNNVMYGGLIGIGIVMVQPFLTATSLDVSSLICVVAFSIAIPLLAGLVLVTHQEAFERHASGSKLVTIAQSVAVFFAFTGIVAGFWHVTWMAGVGVLVASVLAVAVHSAGYTRLMYRGTRDASAPDGSGGSDDTEA